MSHKAAIQALKDIKEDVHFWCFLNTDLYNKENRALNRIAILWDL